MLLRKSAVTPQRPVLETWLGAGFGGERGDGGAARGHRGGRGGGAGLRARAAGRRDARGGLRAALPPRRRLALQLPPHNVPRPAHQPAEGGDVLHRARVRRRAPQLRRARRGGGLPRGLRREPRDADPVLQHRDPRPRRRGRGRARRAEPAPAAPRAALPPVERHGRRDGDAGRAHGNVRRAGPVQRPLRRPLLPQLPWHERLPRQNLAQRRVRRCLGVCRAARACGGDGLKRHGHRLGADRGRG